MATWKDPACESRVDYSRDALEILRQTAVDGLLALPRVGMGRGGLLLGTRESGCVRILEFSPIECAHALGPSFQLTPEETERAREQARTVGPLQVVGCCFSNTRTLSPGARDVELFQTLCPEAWQVLISIKPSAVEASRVAICFRDRAGLLTEGAEFRLDQFEKHHHAPEPAPASAPVRESVVEAPATRVALIPAPKIGPITQQRSWLWTMLTFWRR